jgi:U3 small nucleolar RNA-associated protein 3
MKVNTLLLYLSHVSFYLSLKAAGRGAQVSSHPVMKVLLGLRNKIDQLAKMEQHFAALEEEQDEEEDEEDDEGEEADGAEMDGEEEEEAEVEDDEEEGEDDEDAAQLDDGASEDDDADGFGVVDPANLAGSDLMARQSAQLERLLAGVSSAPAKGKKPAGKSSSQSLTASARAALADFGEADHAREMSRAVSGLGKASGKLAALQAKAAAANKLLEVKQQLAGSKRKKGAADLDGAEDDEPQQHDEAGGWGKKNAKKAKAGADNDAAPVDPAGAALYEATKAAKAAAKAVRAATYAPKTLLPSTWDDMTEDQRRAASKQIKANRGLVRSRRKDKKNPKTANRLRYEKAVVARKGQVQLYQGAQDANYGGQATGIKTTVTKSVSLSA